MRNSSLFLLLILISACASLGANEWKRETVASEKEEWRFCHESLDGPERHGKGMCFIEQECRKRFLRSKECRPVWKMCSWGDLACMDKEKLWDKKIITKDAILILQ